MSLKNNAETQRRRAEADGGACGMIFNAETQRRRAEADGGDSPQRLCASALNPLPSPQRLCASALNPLPRHRAAFTLMELLSVIVIIGILLSAISMALSKARELARRTRAETELREMVSAWLQYHQLYGEYPSLVKGRKDLNTSRKILAPLIDPESADNPRGLILLNPKLPFNAGDFYTDPWGTPYQLSFAQADVEATTAMRTSISFPNRQRRFP